MSKIKVYLSIARHDINEAEDIWAKHYATKESILANGRKVIEESTMSVSSDQVDDRGRLIKDD
jgi:hypothetical protein